MIKYIQLSDEKWLREQVQDKKLSLRTIAKNVGSSYGGVMYAVKRFKIEVPEKKAGPKPGTNMRQIATEAYRKKYPNGRFGAEAAHWKGGKRNLGKNHQYVGIYMPDHPNATSEGYVMEHRLVAEGKIGRYLNPGEIVHHINGIKHDNRPENLEVVNGHKEHARVHFDAIKEVERLKKLVIELGGNPEIPTLDKPKIENTIDI